MIDSTWVGPFWSVVKEVDDNVIAIAMANLMIGLGRFGLDWKCSTNISTILGSLFSAGN